MKLKTPEEIKSLQDWSAHQRANGLSDCVPMSEEDSAFIISFLREHYTPSQLSVWGIK